jgi:CHAT domain-containing protein
LGETATEAASGSTPSDSPHAAPALDVDHLVQLAERLSSTIVVYWTHQMGSYVWVVGRSGSVDAAPIPATMARLRQAVHQAVDVTPDVALSHGSARASVSSGAAREPYRALYRLVWAPVAARIPGEAGTRITIVPQGPLLAVPFAALIDEHGRYLIERHSLHYATSGAVLLEASDRTRHARNTTTNLLVADPAPAATTAAAGLAALPAARDEVQAIAKLLPDQSNVLLGRGASEAAVRRALPHARIVHFATHALVTDLDPLSSHLVLAPAASTRPATDDDGELTASEVASLTLDSDLVVLGSCRSARGKISSDGIAGLTRAIMGAGTASVVATLWDVSDRPTARLMQRFYQELARGRAKDEALRLAQIALIRDLRAGRVTGTFGRTVVTYPELPWLWAAPILVGAP